MKKHSKFADVQPIGFDLREESYAGSDLRVVEVEVEDPHWKVGDGMNDKQGHPDYLIGQIALVSKGKDSNGKNEFDIVFFDTFGKERGRIRVVGK